MPLSKPALAFAAVLWMAALAFVIEPLLVHSALLGRADEALYRAKREGRNRINWARDSV